MEARVEQLLEKHKEDKDLSTEKNIIQPGWDWSGADLSGWDLSGLNLSQLQTPANFQKADLSDANLKKSNISGADFHGAKMRYANLSGVQGEGAKFQQANMRHICLRKANLKDANFSSADLKDSDLDGAHLRDTNFQSAYMKRANLKRTFIGGANFRDANLDNATIKYAELNSKSNFKSANLFQCKFDYSSLKNAHDKLDKVVIQERNGNYLEAHDVYLDLKNYFRREGLYDISGEYFYREKLMERKILANSKYFQDKLKWFISLLYSALCGYGEKPYRVIISSFVIIFIFGTIYMVSNGIIPNSAYDLHWYDNYYFSVVTFTTLGFGDIHPSDSVFIKICTMLEAFTGAFMIALFVVTFSRRLLR